MSRSAKSASHPKAPRAVFVNTVCVDAEGSQRLLMAAQLQTVGRFEDARRLLVHAVAGDPADGNAMSLLATVLSELGEHPGAVETAQRALSLAPESTTIQWRCGIVLLRAKSPRKAQRVLERAVAGRPTQASYRVTLAKALIVQGDTRRALAELREALRLDPTTTEAWNMRAIIFAELGWRGEAQEAAREALRLAPAAARTHLAEGYAALAATDFGRARGAFREALRIDPADFAARAGYGTAAKYALPFLGLLVTRPRATRLICVLVFYVLFLAKSANPALAMVATVLATSVLFLSLNQVATIVVAADRIGRHALRPRELAVAVWTFVNVFALAICLVWNALDENVGARWIAVTLLLAAVQTVLYSRGQADLRNTLVRKLALAGIIVTAVTQGVFLMSGVIFASGNTPDINGALLRTRAVFPVVSAWVIEPAIAVTAIADVAALCAYFIALWISWFTREQRRRQLGASDRV